MCVELTKMFEQVDRDHLAVLAESYRDKRVKGEITVVIAGSNPKFVGEEPGGHRGDDDGERRGC